MKQNSQVKSPSNPQKQIASQLKQAHDEQPHVSRQEAHLDQASMIIQRLDSNTPLQSWKLKEPTNLNLEINPPPQTSSYHQRQDSSAGSSSFHHFQPVPILPQHISQNHQSSSIHQSPRYTSRAQGFNPGPSQFQTQQQKINVVNTQDSQQLQRNSPLSQQLSFQNMFFTGPLEAGAVKEKRSSPFKLNSSQMGSARGFSSNNNNQVGLPLTLQNAEELLQRSQKSDRTHSPSQRAGNQLTNTNKILFHHHFKSRQQTTKAQKSNSTGKHSANFQISPRSLSQEGAFQPAADELELTGDSNFMHVSPSSQTGFYSGQAQAQLDPKFYLTQQSPRNPFSQLNQMSVAVGISIVPGFSSGFGLASNSKNVSLRSQKQPLHQQSLTTVKSLERVAENPSQAQLYQQNRSDLNKRKSHNSKIDFVQQELLKQRHLEKKRELQNFSKRQKVQPSLVLLNSSGPVDHFNRSKLLYFKPNDGQPPDQEINILSSGLLATAEGELVPNLNDEQIQSPLYKMTQQSP